MTENNQNKLIFQRPASWYGGMWRESLPIGNGNMGALISGGVGEENIIINRTDLWHWGKDNPLPDVSHILNLARDAMDSGDYQRANDMLFNTLMEKGYNSNTACPFPLGKLNLRFKCQDQFAHYKRVLDMQTGEAIVRYNQDDISVVRKAFISRRDDVMVYEISSNNEIDVKVSLSMHDDDDSEDYKKKLDELKESLTIEYNDDYIFYKACNEKDGEFGAVLKLAILDGGETYTNGRYFHIQKTQRILILVKTFSFSDGEAAFKTIRSQLDGMQMNYDKLLEGHAPLHGQLYNSSSINIIGSDYNLSNEQELLNAYSSGASKALIEKMWRFGRYLFVSGIGRDGTIFPLYGLWHGQYKPVWSQNVANENVQMIYWHAQTGGLIDLVKPMINYYFNKIEDFKISARKLFGCRGIYVSTYTTLKNSLPNPVVPVIIHWISGAGWLSQHFYEYYQATGDEKILREKIMPFMVEAAKFYEDYVVYNNGKMVIYPSVSPENSPDNFIPEDFKKHMDHIAPTVKNATMDFAIMKELLTNLIAVCTSEQLHLGNIETWEKMLKSIPEYQINQDNAIKEWMDKDLLDHNCHRHLSHIYPVFPGKESATFEDENLISAFEKAVDMRELGGQSGWSLAHMASIYARFGRGEDSIRCINTLVKGCTLNNLFTLHNDYRNMGLTLNLGQSAPVQLDANMGFVNALQEMLFYVSEGMVKFLPALPKIMEYGNVENFCFYSGKASFKWNREEGLFEADIAFKTSNQDKICFVLPNFIGKFEIIAKDCDYNIINGKSVEVSFNQYSHLNLRTTNTAT